MTDIEVLERGKQCVQRKASTNCSDCANCDLLMDDSVILTAYDRAISAIRSQQDNSRKAKETVWISVQDRMPEK